MKKYIHAATSRYPCYDTDIRSAVQHVSFGTDIPDEDAISFGYHPVTEVVRPVAGEGQAVDEVLPVLTNDVWTQQWQVRTLTKVERDALATQMRERALEVGIDYDFPTQDGLVSDGIQLRDRDISILNSIRQVAYEKKMENDTTFVQPFRSRSDRFYFLSAQQVIDMTDHAFQQFQAIYAASWSIKDAE